MPLQVALTPPVAQPPLSRLTDQNRTNPSPLASAQVSRVLAAASVVVPPVLLTPIIGVTPSMAYTCASVRPVHTLATSSFTASAAAVIAVPQSPEAVKFIVIAFTVTSTPAL